MKNTSKKNLLFQFKTIIEGVSNEINFIEKDSESDILDINCDEMIECFEGIKEIQVALKTLTN